MNRRRYPTQKVRVKIINMVLYPQEEQIKENYVNLFNSIYRDKLSVKTHGDRFTGIRTLYSSDNDSIIYGELFNAIFPDPEQPAINRLTNEIQDLSIDPNTGMGLKTWSYYFFPEYHRLVIPDNISINQVLRFLHSAVNRYYDTDSFEINVEKDRDIIDRIIEASALTKLFVRVSYSNNDNNEAWQEVIDEQLRGSGAKNVSLDISATKKNPINISNSDMLQGFVGLSGSNGYTEASLLHADGIIESISTSEHPMVKTVQYSGEDPGEELKTLVRNISNNRL